MIPAESDEGQPALIYKLCGTPMTSDWSDAAKLPLWWKYTPSKEIKRDLDDTLRVSSKLTDRKPFFTREATSLLDGLLALNPTKRLQAVDALKHSYFEVSGGPMEPNEMPIIF